MVGSISERKERMYGELLAKYLVDPQTLFIVSSDFCHWYVLLSAKKTTCLLTTNKRGLRFSYTEYRSEPRAPLVSLRSLRNTATTGSMPIFKSISDLDHEGMEKIETLDHAAFCQYLRDTNNTICGRHPIGVLMGALETIDKERRIRFIKYAQSNECQDVRDSSVSYTSAYTYIAL